MDSVFPGSVVERSGKSAGDFLSGLFFATKGITLLQVAEMTGLETSVIQNWISRGWVQRAVEKRYTGDHLARIMIINMLKSVTSLETISNILSFINGDANDRTDDIISEAQLYIYICDILDKLPFDDILDSTALKAIIKTEVAGYTQPFEGAYEKLCSSIKVIITYYIAALLKFKADNYMAGLTLE